MDVADWSRWEQLIDDRGTVIERPRGHAHPLYRSRSAGHVRELSFSDVQAAPRGRTSGFPACGWRGLGASLTALRRLSGERVRPREDVEMVIETSARLHAAQTSDRLRIEFLFRDLTTCTRCLAAEQALESALDVVREVLQATGVRVEVDKVLVESEEQARRWVRELADDPGERRRRGAGAAGELVWFGTVYRWLRRSDRLSRVGAQGPGVQRAAGCDDRRCDPRTRLRPRVAASSISRRAIRAAGEPGALLLGQSRVRRGARLLPARGAEVLLRRRG
jgi:Domain of unknown function (DUF2703)